MGVYIPNMEKPKSCWECVKSLDIECCGDIRNCPIIDIVTCGECKHSKEWYRDRLMCHLWAEFGVSVFEDGYCSYGERIGNE